VYKIVFYKDRNGKRPVADYFKELAGNTDKGSRIKLDKIHDYIETLKASGTRIGEPYVKHLSGEIWELRPLKDRILFAAWDGSKFILLHHFVKKTQKTPPKEIKKAKRNLSDFKKRSADDNG